MKTSTMGPRLRAGTLVSLAFAALVALAGCSNPSGNSTPAATAAPVPAPGAATALTATLAGPTSASLKWTAGSNAASYDIFWSTAATQPTGTANLTVSSTSTTATALTAGSTYNFWVVAKNATGSAAAATTSLPFTLPTNPTTSILAAAAGTTSVQLSWSYAAAAGSAPASGFEVFRSTANVAPTSTTAPTYTLTSVGTGAGQYSLSGTAYSFTDATGLTTGTKYYYWVAAFNPVGASALLNGSATPGPVPAALTVSALSGAANVALTWTDPNTSASLAGNLVTGYQVLWSTTSTAPVVLTASNSATVAAGTLTYTPAGLTAYTPYYFWVKAQNAIGTSTATAVQGIVGTDPGSPTALAAAPAAPSYTALTLTWTAPATGTVTGYQVSYGPHPTAFSGATAWTGTVSPAGTTLTGLTEGTSYDVYVVAVNAVYTAAAAPSSAYTWTTAPAETPAAATASTGARAGLVTGTTVGTGPGTLALAWTAPASGGTVSDYKVYYQVHSSAAPVSAPAGATLADTNGTVASYTLTSLDQTKNYDVWVEADSAFGSIGQVLMTDPANGAAPVAPPDPVTNVAATETGIPITVTWTGDATDTTYNIYVATSATKPSTPTATGLTSASYTLTKVNAASTYHFWVDGVNGKGSASADAGATFASLNPTAAPNINGWYLLGGYTGSTTSSNTPEGAAVDVGALAPASIKTLMVYTSATPLADPTTSTHTFGGVLTGQYPPVTTTTVSGDTIVQTIDGAFGEFPYNWAYITDTNGNVLVYSYVMTAPAFGSGASVTSSAVGANGFTVSWPAATGTSTYLLTWGTGASQNQVVTGTTYSPAGLISGTQYNVSVSPVGTGVFNGVLTPADGIAGTALTTTVTTGGDLPLTIAATSVYPVMDESTTGNIGWPSPPYSFNYDGNGNLVSISDNGTANAFSGTEVDFIFDLGAAKTVSSMQWWWNAGPATYEIDGTNDITWATSAPLVTTPSPNFLNSTVSYAVNATVAYRYIRIHVANLAAGNLAGNGNWGLSLNSVVITGH